MEYHNQINNDVVNAQLTCVELVCDSLLNVDVLTSVCRQSIGEPQKSNEHVIVSTPEATALQTVVNEFIAPPIYSE